LSQLEEDIQNGFRSIEASRQERDAGTKRAQLLQQLNTDQQATESKIEELQILKKETAMRLASLNNETDKVVIDKLVEEERVLEQQLSAETAKLVPLAQKREEFEVIEVKDSFPDQLPDLIALQKILIQKRHSAKKPIVALELDKETKGLMDQLNY